MSLGRFSENTSKMKEIKIPQLLINSYSAKPGLKRARTIAVWALLRKAYKDNTIRNYRGKLLYFSKLFGISEYVLRQLIAEMERQGYATRSNGSLKLTPDHILTAKDCKINKYLDGSDFGRLTKTIMAQPIMTSVNRQQHKISNTMGRRFVKTWQEHETYIVDEKLAHVNIKSYPNVSNSTFAKKSGNTSVGAGYKFKRELEAIGLIKTRQRILIHGEFEERAKAHGYQKQLCTDGKFYFCRRINRRKYRVFSYLSSAVYNIG